jgi:SpoVK/Ycf46/Vps4 family AAA+-type ATPase
MATAEQLRYLIQSHFTRDEERFTTVALQVAAHEARAGHSQLAHEIRTLIDKRQQDDAKVIQFRPDLSDLVRVEHDLPNRLGELIVAPSLRDRVDRVLREFRQQDKLKSHALSHRRKLMLCGPPGTGKTMTAAIIAGELGLPLCTILLDKLVTKFMGETGAKLRQVFDAIAQRTGVFLFDEFDAIGAERNRDNDVGEIRRVLNAFLQLIEQDRSDSIIITATNNHGILDHALFRRFDDVLTYQLPGKEDVAGLLNNCLHNFRPATLPTSKVVLAAKGLSHGELTLACRDAIKEAVLADHPQVDGQTLLNMLAERRAAKISSVKRRKSDG